MLAALPRRRRREVLRFLLVKVRNTGQYVVGCRCQVSRVVIVEVAEEPWSGLALTKRILVNYSLSATVVLTSSKNDPHDGFGKAFGQASILDDGCWLSTIG